MENLAPMLPLFGALSALAAVVWLLLLLTRAVDIKRIRQVVVMISTPFVDWLLRRLTMVANAKRIRQLVVKDNDIADDEKRGLSIESVSCVVAHWRDDTIEFKPSFVLRNRWIDSWNILEYKGDFSITDFATTYRLEPALSTPPLHPLSAACPQFSIRWNPDQEVRERLKLSKDRVVLVLYNIHLIVRCQREGDEPITVPLERRISSEFIVNPSAGAAAFGI